MVKCHLTIVTPWLRVITADARPSGAHLQIFFIVLGYGGIKPETNPMYRF